MASGVGSRLSLGLKLFRNNGLLILKEDLKYFLQSPFFLVELRKALLARWRLNHALSNWPQDASVTLQSSISNGKNIMAVVN